MTDLGQSYRRVNVLQEVMGPSRFHYAYIAHVEYARIYLVVGD
jgi:hypothetical protein